LRWAPLEGISVHYSGELALRIATTTNGTTLGSAAVRCHLLKSYTELTISVDAPGEAHDRMRGAPGLYAALSRNFRRLADERDRTGSPLRLRANVVLMRRTLGTFEQLCRELAAWGIDEISLNQLGGNDRPEFYPAQRLALADTTFLEAAFRPCARNSNVTACGCSEPRIICAGWRPRVAMNAIPIQELSTRYGFSLHRHPGADRALQLHRRNARHLRCRDHVGRGTAPIAGAVCREHPSAPDRRLRRLPQALKYSESLPPRP